MLTRLWPVRLAWIVILTSCLSLLASVGRQRDPDPGPERPLDLGQVDVDDPARVDPGDPDRAADADPLAVAEDDVDRPLRGQEARPAAGQAEQAEQARQRRDDHPTDQDLAARGSTSASGFPPQGRLRARAIHGAGGASRVGPNAGPAW